MRAAKKYLGNVCEVGSRKNSGVYFSPVKSAKVVEVRCGVKANPVSYRLQSPYVISNVDKRNKLKDIYQLVEARLITQTTTNRTFLSSSVVPDHQPNNHSIPSIP